MDYYNIQNWTPEQMVEYVENFDLNKEVIDLYKDFFDVIQIKVSNPTKKGCIDLLGHFGSGKSHILLFLAILLSKDDYPQNIKDLIDSKIQEVEGEEFFSDFNDIHTLLNQESEGSEISGTLIIPIRLAEYQGKEFDTILEQAITKYILKEKNSLISDVKVITTFFDTNLKEVATQLHPQEINDLEDLYQKLISDETQNYDLIANAAKKINKALIESIGRTTSVSQNPLEDICKLPELALNKKNIIFLFDELTQWWTGDRDVLLKKLQAISEKIDGISKNELKDDLHNVMENRNVVAIFSHQRDIWRGPLSQGVKGRFHKLLEIKGTYINSIIFKRFYTKDEINIVEITKLAKNILNKLKSLNLSEETIESIYSTDLNPDLKEIESFDEKIIKNLISFYPFHPYYFKGTMKSLFNKFSTEDRGTLTFIQDCFTEYDYLLDKEMDELINIDVFFTVFHESRELFRSNEDFENLYLKLDRARIERDPDDTLSESILQVLFLKLLTGNEDPKLSKEEIKAIFIISDNEFEATIRAFVDFCIDVKNYIDINWDGISVELTMSKTEPIAIYLNGIKSKIEEENIYNYLLKKLREEESYLAFNPNTNNLRFKNNVYTDFNIQMNDLINIIENTENTIGSLSGRSKNYYIQVHDLIYYFLPPRPDILSSSFNIETEIINHVANPKIMFIICKPKNTINDFGDSEKIRTIIAKDILEWILTKIRDIDEGNRETAYEDNFQGKLSVPDYSKIAEIADQLSTKNASILDNLKVQNNAIIAEETIDIKAWKLLCRCSYKFDQLESEDFSRDNIVDIENEFESSKYFEAIELSEEINGNISDYIWKIIFDEKGTEASSSNRRFECLEIGNNDLLLLSKFGINYSLRNENNIHSVFLSIEEEINNLTDKTEILEFCYNLRTNEYGLNIYPLILCLFYLYQKSKVVFFNKNNEKINMESKTSRGKIILSDTNQFLMSLLNDRGQLFKVEQIPSEKWEFVIGEIINYKNRQLIKISENFEDGTPIDLNVLKASQSSDRERKFFEIIKNYISTDDLKNLQNKITVFLTRLDLEKNVNVKENLKIDYFINMIDIIKGKVDIEELHSFLFDKKDNIDVSLNMFDSVKKFCKEKLTELENIIKFLNNMTT